MQSLAFFSVTSTWQLWALDPFSSIQQTAGPVQPPSPPFPHGIDDPVNTIDVVISANGPP